MIEPTDRQWEKQKKRQNYCCLGCGISFDEERPSRDHIVPQSKGGGLTKKNIQALCVPCNQLKKEGTMQQLEMRNRMKN